MANLEQLKELLGGFTKIDYKALIDALDETHFESDYTDKDIALLQWLFENGGEVLSIAKEGAEHKSAFGMWCNEILDSLDAVGEKQKQAKQTLEGIANTLSEIDLDSEVSDQDELAIQNIMTAIKEWRSDAVGKEEEVDWCKLLFANWPTSVCDIHMMVFPSGKYHLNIVMKNEDDPTQEFEGATYQECAHLACAWAGIKPGV